MNWGESLKINSVTGTVIRGVFIKTISLTIVAHVHHKTTICFTNPKIKNQIVCFKRNCSSRLGMSKKYMQARPNLLVFSIKVEVFCYCWPEITIVFPARLTAEGHSVLFQEIENWNAVQIVVNGETVYKCSIKDLDYGGDGIIDPLCSEAVTAVEKAYWIFLRLKLLPSIVLNVWNYFMQHLTTCNNILLVTKFCTSFRSRCKD